MKKQTQNLLSILLWALALGWAGVLFFFSGQSGAESGELSMRVTRWLIDVCPWIPISAETLEPVLRKLAHFGIFAVEGALLGAAIMVSLRRRGIAIAAAVCLSAAVAVLNEWHQSFSEGRCCAVSDMVIDTAGAAAGILFAALLVYLIQRAVSRHNNVII